MSTVIELKNVTKTYQTGAKPVHALANINFSVKKGEMVAVMGPSGSGKTTLMNIIGLLDRPTSGQLIIDGEEISLDISDAKLAALRSQKIGFVFQTFNLLPRMSALSNVLMPVSYNKLLKPDAKENGKKLLEMVGLSQRGSHRPFQLSGGEQQRVAIARALVNDPEIILADEPTGNLDSKSGEEIIEIMASLNKKGKTLVIITHNEKIAEHCSRVIKLLDGNIRGND